MPTTVPERPRLRGRIHLAAAVVSVGGLAWLVSAAKTPAAMVAAWIYGISMVLLYSTSSTYHVFAYGGRFRSAFRRADHSMIFVLIAGTATPVCILAMTGTTRWWLLGAMWTIAVGGVVFKIVALERFPKTGAALYIALGWSGLLALPALIHRPVLLALIVAGGVIYTVGATLFGMAKPRLSESWFGYHELWHVLGVAAGVLMFAANITLVSTSGA